MRNYLLALGAVALSAAIFPASAQPQPGAAPGGARSNYSPYLNLARGGSAGLNYFGLVRPEQQLRQQANQIQQQVSANSQAIQSSAGTTGEDALPITGRGASFNNLSHYFNNFPLGGGGGGPTTGRSANQLNNRVQIGQSPQGGSKGGGSGARGARR